MTESFNGGNIVVDPNMKDSFKNPWTTIPRPMNRFSEISHAQYERQEKEKQDLQRVLQDQIEQKKARVEEEKRKLIEEEQRFEAKLARERVEMANKDRQEKEEAENKVKKARQAN
jgi:CRISPR/Cas system CMR subunit Cmr4 (Cas7 group RAMP superfamily)